MSNTYGLLVGFAGFICWESVAGWIWIYFFVMAERYADLAANNVVVFP